MRRAWPLVLALMVPLAGLANAQGPATAGGPTVSEEVGATPPTAPVVVDGKTLFRLRGVSAYPAEQRARDVAGRIVQTAANRSLSPDSLSVVTTPDVTWLQSGSVRLMGLVDADSRLEAIGRETLATVYLHRVREAVVAYRRDRESSVLARAALWGLAATLGFAAALLCLYWLHRRLSRAFEARYRSRVRGLEIQAFQIVRAERLWHAAVAVLTAVRAALVIVAAYLYLEYVLFLFPWTRGAAAGLAATVAVPVKFFGDGAVSVFPKLVFLAILIVLTRYLLRLIRLFFDGVAAGRVAFQSFSAEWAAPTYRLVRLLVVGFAVVVAYPYIPGSQSDAFKGVTLFAGLVFSLGSSSFIGNLIAGYSMTYRGAFRVGDVIKVGQHLGTVESTTLMVTRLRTPKGEDVVLPNSQILNGDVVNYSTLARQGELVLHTTVGIGYETSWRQVEAMLLEAASRTDSLLKEPKPFVLQTLLGDFAVTYELNVYCDSPGLMARHYARLHQNILDVFNEYGVQIMTPAYEGDPEQPKIVPRSEWFQPPAVKQGV